MSTAAPKIEIAALRKSFGSLEVLKGIDVAVGTGGVVALIGPSGSGKSTLLRCINLLVMPDAGTIRVGDARFVFGGSERLPDVKHLAAFRARTGMVFQHFNLFPHMSVLGNVMEALVLVRKLPSRWRRIWRWSICARSGWPTARTRTPAPCPAGRNNASPSRAPWRWSRRSCCSMR